ncbi:MAG: TIGR01212 family radical SAM protein [Bacteroidales bacterium]|nr:TIGR01212 family radical SAM protein [Bacteroidales bacterium]
MTRYNSASEYYKKIFNHRVQKISIDAGFTCPNRDGKKGRGGCTYCNNDTFKPFYCSPEKSISQQLTEGIAFFSEKYKAQDYLAYFQSFSNTYAPFEELKKMYQEALAIQGVIGLVIATRPDCVDEQILDYLAELSKKYFILIEFGVESTKNETLKKINRLHTFEETKQALKWSAERNLNTGIHLILGLPNETEEEMLQHAVEISKLKFTFLKLHQLQIVKKTMMAKDFEKKPEDYTLFTLENYIDFVVKFMELLSPEIIVERFTSETPAEMLIAPIWGRVKNFEIVHKIEKRLVELDSGQGKLFSIAK